MSKPTFINEELKYLLNGASAKFFIQNYEKLASKIATFSDLYDDHYTMKSNASRISKSKKIFDQRLNIEALKHIIQSEKTNQITKEKAVTLLEKHDKNQKKFKRIDFSQGQLTDFSKLSQVELVQIYSDSIVEMKKRKMIRSMKVTGDIGEFYIEEYFKNNYPEQELKLFYNQSTKHSDAMDKNGNKYQIKTTTTKDTGDFANIIDVSNKHFDFLLVCKLDQYLNLETIYQLKWNDFWEVKVSRKAQGVYKITINGEFKKGQKFYMASSNFAKRI